MTENPDPVTLSLPAEDDTTRLGAWLAGQLRPGDTLLLEGPVGAGKTHLARSLIRARTGLMQDVPSPTFTLVQTYEAGDTEIWHADLYRLTHPDEVAELGLEAAMATAICLIEWPDRLGAATPPDALHLRLDPDGTGRRVILTGTARHAGLLSRLRAGLPRQPLPAGHA